MKNRRILLKKTTISLLIILFFSALVNGQEKVNSIEILTVLHVGWHKGDKIMHPMIIKNGQIYKQKRTRLIEIGKADSLNILLMDRKVIDAIFRGDKNQCESGYEISIRLIYHVTDHNVDATYTYNFTSPATCDDVNATVYLRKVTDEIHKFRNT